MAARIGFDSLLLAILNEQHTVKKEYSIDATEGGAISATISGLGAPMSVKYASNVAFYVLSKGTGAVEVELEIADLPQEALNDIMGAVENEKGIVTLGPNTKPPDRKSVV